MTDHLIDIGGNHRPLNFGRNAMVEFEKLTGIGIYSRKFTFENVEVWRALVYVGLKWGLYKRDGQEPRPSFTLLTVGDWIDEHPNQAKLFVQIIDAWKESQPKSEEPKNESAPAPGAAAESLAGTP
jgi:hypothetical protein